MQIRLPASRAGDDRLIHGVTPEVDNLIVFEVNGSKGLNESDLVE
jgi:hypothetical protein